jgi:hypothetical protein
MKQGRALPGDIGGNGAAPILNTMTHREFLMKLDNYCNNQQEPIREETKLSYLFFVANVVAKSQIDNDNPQFYYSIVKELLRQHKKFLLFNKHLLLRTMSKGKLMRRMSRQLGGPKKISDEVKHVFKCEGDLIAIMEMCEPMDDPMINELLKLAEFTQL